MDCMTNTMKGITIDNDNFLNDTIACDIGPQTIAIIIDVGETAKSVVWNGIARYVEKEQYRTDTISIVHAVAKSSARCLIGGGNTVATLSNFDISSLNIPTDGGAMPLLLMGRELPTVRPS